LILKETVAFAKAATVFLLCGAETACLTVLNRFEDSVWEFEWLSLITIMLDCWLHMCVVHHVGWSIEKHPSGRETRVGPSDDDNLFYLFFLNFVNYFLESISLQEII